MRAVVLVGGEGTRLRPLTEHRPKQLLPVCGVPMLERVVGQLARGGVDQVVLSLGYRPEDFLAVYGAGTIAGVPCTCVVEPELLDTAGAIRYAATEAGIDDTFVAVNGDVLSDIDVSALAAFHADRSAEATIALVAVADPSRFGVVVTDSDGRVTAFVEKPAPGTAPARTINAGAYVMEPSVLDRVAPGVRVSVERQTFPALAADGRLFARVVDSYWLDTGTPEAYLQAHRDLVHGVRGGPPVPDARLAADGLWTQAGAQVHGAAGEGTLVGRNAVVAAGAAVRDSCIDAGASVEAGAVVEGSVLLPGATVGPGARVERSVLGFGAVVETGAEVLDGSVVGDGAVVTAGTRVVAGRVGGVASAASVEAGGPSPATEAPVG